MRRIHDLKLVRNQTPFFELSWTALHRIDETSPLYGETPESLAAREVVITVILTGTDETVAQSIHARQAYTPDTILWNMRFVDLFSKTPDGRRYIDYTCFHRVIPIAPNPE
jgi:inward rectifier potassium channel